MKPKQEEQIVCPACGCMVTKRTLIFHMKKKAVFEIYDWYKNDFIHGRNKIVADHCPHEMYIQENQVMEPTFSIE